MDGAIALLDDEGLDGLTTRKLGAALNVQGPALYRHFPSKEALLDAMADRLLEPVAAPLPDGPWDEKLALLAGRLRSALLAHRDGARVVAGTYVTGPNTRLVENTILKTLQAAGHPADRAGWAAFAISYYVLGHSIEEQAQARLSATGDWTSRKRALIQHPDPDYAHTALTKVFDADPAERFDYGIRLLLKGIRHELHHATPKTTSHRPPENRAQ
ncbi:TetR/AcrR family transcriptional regulator C-terminal domain-containing protein [Amycolatopsis pithecellobii]|uniref:TetR/AcrR family transcriptional regulator C-terminal domain-containing protein n=1 Tax=Amycolatopsis pithecellobii TaxID=664692 RepID=UPI00140C8159|nr:TetR/AcrR family transcriptional regulator C-terminal domain-containing protein [Amycolatopsis pithecellobii]